MAKGIIRTNPIGRFSLWDMRTDAGEPEAALGAEFWDAASGTNVSLTGQGEAEAQGVLGVTVSIALTGQAEAETQGALTPNAGVNIALSGQVETETPGSLGISASVGLNGQLETENQGSLTPTTGAIVALSGQGETETQGSLGVSFAVGLLGQQYAELQGVVTPSVFTSVSLTGQQETESQGALGVDVQPGDAAIFSGGIYTGFVRRVRREEQERRKKLTLKKVEDDALDEIRAIVDDANSKGKALKQAYSDVKGAQKELFEAEQRLILFLEGQELELLAQDEFDLIKVIAELL